MGDLAQWFIQTYCARNVLLLSGGPELGNGQHTRHTSHSLQARKTEALGGVVLSTVYDNGVGQESTTAVNYVLT